MTPTMLRQLWSLIEMTQTHLLLRLDDASLVQWLLQQFKQQRSLNHEEIYILNDYLNNRLSLIRDLAQQRESGGQQKNYSSFPVG
jgi:hypothetical protein